MRLCMFHPLEEPLERGWPGRVDGERVIQLAAQTLQAFFTGGGTAREHAVYPLSGVRLLAPVLHPPAVRLFEDQETFVFANPAAVTSPRPPRDVGVHGPREKSQGVRTPAGAREAAASTGDPNEVGASESPRDNLSQGLIVLPRLAAVVGAEGRLGGYTLLAEWRDPSRRAPKDRDFALVLGPLAVTPDEFDPGSVEAVVRVDGDEATRGGLPAFEWAAARDLAAEGTALFPGDLLAGPPLAPVAPRARVEIEVAGVGTLDATFEV